MVWDVVVMGAGAAGLSAATKLSECGKKVLVLEKRPLLGGRTTSYLDKESNEVLDNGQHLFLGCYRETKTFLQRIGKENDLRFYSNFRTMMVGPQGQRSFLAPANLPAPFGLAVGLFRYRAIPLVDRVRMRAVLNQIQDEDRDLSRISVSTWLSELGQSKRAIEVFWEPFVLATLNVQLDRAPANLLAIVLKKGFLGSKEDSAFGLSAVGLQDLMGLPAKDFIEKRGGEVRMNTSVIQVQFNTNDVTLGLSDGTTICSRVVVSALPPDALRKIFENHVDLSHRFSVTKSLSPSAILSLHVWAEASVDLPEMVGLWGFPIHWIFQRKKFVQDRNTTHLSLVISGAEPYLNHTREELRALAEEALQRVLGYRVGIRRIMVSTDRKATWVPPLGDVRCRLSCEVPSFPLFLAGDWTDTGLPCTIESAVLSGHRVAEKVTEYFIASTTSLTKHEQCFTPPSTVSIDKEIESEVNQDAEVPSKEVPASGLPFVVDQSDFISAWKERLSSVVDFDPDSTLVTNLKTFREQYLDELMTSFEGAKNSAEKDFLSYLIRTLAISSGVVPASLRSFWKRKQKGDLFETEILYLSFREPSYPLSRQLFQRLVQKNIFSICFRFTESDLVSPTIVRENMTTLMAAALREQFIGPIFFEIAMRSIDSKESMKEWVQRWQGLIQEGLANILIDTRECFHASGFTFDDQQRNVGELAGYFMSALQKSEGIGSTLSFGMNVSCSENRRISLDDLRGALTACYRIVEEEQSNPEGLQKIYLDEMRLSADENVRKEFFNDVNGLLGSAFKIFDARAIRILSKPNDRLPYSLFYEACLDVDAFFHLSEKDQTSLFLYLLERNKIQETQEEITDAIEVTRFRLPISEAFYRKLCT